MRLLLLVIVFAFAVPTAVSAAPSASDSSSAAVQAIMNTRAQAILSGDKQAFLNTIDPLAPSTFRDAQATSFDGWHSLPLQSLNITVRLDDSGDLAPGLHIATKHHADAAYLPETRVTYQLQDYDDRPSFDSQWLSYVERNGTWYVAASDDTTEIGLDSNVEIWDFGPMTVQKTPHFLVLTHPDQAQRGAALASIAEDAMTTFQSRWTQPWSGRLPLLVPGSAQETQMVLRTVSQVADFAAFTTYIPYRDATGWHTTAPRIYAQDDNLATAPRVQQVGTIVHELTHAATAGLEGPFTPTWEHEGIAEWTRLGNPTSVTPPSGSAPALPDPSAFTSGTSSQIGDAYVSATSATAFISATAGSTAPVALFKQVGSLRSVPGSSSYNLNAAFVQVLGKSIDQFVSNWDAAYPTK